MYKLIITTIAACCLNGTITAQDQIDGTSIPGQRVFKSVDYASALVLRTMLDDLLGDDTTQIINSANRLNIYTIKYSVPKNENERDAINHIFSSEQDSGQLIWDEPNRVINAHGQTGSLWVSGMDINATSYQSQYAVQQLELDQTHQNLSRGQGTLVAVLDTGIDPDHPVLSGRVSELGYNAIQTGGSTDDSGIGDHAGHGTFIAGLVALVAPEARLLPVTVLRPDGVGYPVDVADGIDYAIMQGAHVIVLALGTTVPSTAMINAIDNALERGITVVAAAGNTLPSPTEASILFPASHSTGTTIGVFAVGASDALDDLAVFSNYHEKLDLMAPGVSTIDGSGIPDPSSSVIGPLPGGSFAAANGTSFSTGFAAGIAALARAQYRSWPDEFVAMGQIPGELHTVIPLTDTYITMPIVPANPIAQKPRANARMACDPGPGLTFPGDIDGDGKIDGADLSRLLGGWGALGADGSLHGANLLHDDLINGGDLSLLLGHWTSSGD